MKTSIYIISILTASVFLISPQTQAEALNHPDWPQQNQIDLSPFIALSKALFDSPFDERSFPDPALQACEMSKDRQALAAGLTSQGSRHFNPATNTPDAALGLTTKVQSITIYSTAAGCATLDSTEYLTSVPDEEKASFSTQHVQQPVFIRARFSAGSTNKKGILSDSAIVIQHLPTDIPDYPWVAHSWHKFTWKNTKAAYGIAHWPPMTNITLTFESASGETEFHNIQLGKVSTDVAKNNTISLTVNWNKNDHNYSRMWSGEIIHSLRDGKRHGINYSGFNTTNFSFEFDCFLDGIAQDYYQVVNTYDCETATENEFGIEGVFRSSGLVKLAAEAEAEAQLAATANTAATGRTTGSATADGAAECVKAYAAARVCQNMPSDPFGIARGICTSTVKSKFGGSGCTLPF